MARTKQTARKTVHHSKVFQTPAVNQASSFTPNIKKKRTIKPRNIDNRAPKEKFKHYLQLERSIFREWAILESLDPLSYPDITLYLGESSIGRSSICNIILTDTNLSSKHCTIKRSWDDEKIQDDQNDDEEEDGGDNEDGGEDEEMKDTQSSDLSDKPAFKDPKSITTIHDHSTNGTYINGIKIGKDNQQSISNNQIISLFKSKSNNIQYKFKIIKEGYEYEEEVLKKLKANEIKEICEWQNIDLTGSNTKDSMIKSFVDQKISKQLYSNWNDSLNEDKLQLSPNVIIPLDSLIKIIRYAWYRPCIGNMESRKTDYRWKLSLATINKQVFNLIKKINTGLCLVNLPIYPYYRETKFSLLDRLQHPCNTLNNLVKLDIFDKDLYCMIDKTKFPGAVKEMTSLANLKTLILHRFSGFNKRVELEENGHYDYKKIEFPSITKVRLINPKESYFNAADSLSFPSLVTYDISNDIRSIENWSFLVSKNIKTILMNKAERYDLPINNLNHFGYIKSDGEDVDSVDSDQGVTTLTIPKSFFNQRKSTFKQLVGTLTTIYVCDLLTPSLLITTLKQFHQLSNNQIQTLIVYVASINTIINQPLPIPYSISSYSLKSNIFRFKQQVFKVVLQKQ